MSILFSGDFHANSLNELHLITKRTLLLQFGEEKFSSIKYHIILGDGGFMWQGNSKTDLFNYKVLANRSFPILCVIGNHEPILGMNSLPETDIGIGENVIQINDNPFAAYFKRGKIYNIEGLKFLALGGALSIDKKFRQKNISWWENEYWSQQEKDDIFTLLETNNTFDYVISHTGPQRINKKIFKDYSIYSEKFNDEVAWLNDDIDQKINCRQWWCGHWHKDFYYFDKTLQRGYQYLYTSTKIL